MKRKYLMFTIVLLSCIFIGGWTYPPPGWKKLAIVENEFYIQTSTANLTIYTVEKRLKIPIPQKFRKAVLLVHGSGSGYGYWDIPIGDYSMMDFLAKKGLDVYAVDQRGYGKSPLPPPLTGFDVNAEKSTDDLKSVIDFIKIRSGVEKVDLVGHSWGAGVAAVLADTYKDHIRNVVLIGFPYQKFNPLYPIPPSLPPFPYVPNLHWQTFRNNLFLYEPEVADYYENMIKTQYASIPTGVLGDGLTFAYKGHVPKITAPTLLINGSREYVVDMNDSANCLNDLGTKNDLGEPTSKDFQVELNKDLLIIPNAYHLIFLEKVAHTLQNEAVLYWLNFNDPEVIVGPEMP